MYVCMYCLPERRSPAYPTVLTLLYRHDLVWGVFTGALALLRRTSTLAVVFEEEGRDGRREFKQLYGTEYLAYINHFR